MARRKRFDVVFAPEVLGHLDAIERKHHGLIERTIDEQLSFTPERETRNRKPLRQPAPFAATWELRLGPDNRFRVFYEMNAQTKTVEVLAIGCKKGNRLTVGGEEIEL